MQQDQTDMAIGLIYKLIPWVHQLILQYVLRMQKLAYSKVIMLILVEDMV